ncbi:nucleotidyltransferase family protein [Chloroflexota bacterium]
MSDNTQKEDRIRQIPPSAWGLVVEQAQRHYVMPLLYWQLKALPLEQGISDELWQKLHTSYKDNARHNLLRYAELERMLNALQEAGIRTIVLKGAHLAELIYKNIALRGMTDIDLLVDKRNLEKASQILTNTGYQTEREYRLQEELANDKIHHLPLFRKENRVAVEIHWALIPPKTCIQVDHIPLWDRALPTSIADAQALVLSAEDLVLHLCVHLCQHRFSLGLRHLFDIAQTLSFYENELDWEILCRRAGQWRAHKCVYIILHLAKGLLNAPIPNSVMEQLQPADFSPNIEERARERVLHTTSTNLGVAELWRPEPLSIRLKRFTRRIFVPSKNLAYQYGLERGSKRVYFYYFVRLKDLFQQYGQQLWCQLRGEPTTATLVQQENLLDEWWKDSEN